MDDSYPDWKADTVKLVSECNLDSAIETDACFSVSYLIANRHGQSVEQSPIFPGRIDLNSRNSLCLATESSSSMNQDVTNVIVKIKKEITEDVTPSPVSYLEASYHVRSIEQSPVFPGRIDLNSGNSMCLATESSLSTNQDVTGMMVKIKEEITEDVTPSPGCDWSTSTMPLVFVDCSTEIKKEVITNFHNCDTSKQHFSPETDSSPVFKESAVFPSEIIHFKVEDDLAEECVNRQLDMPKSNKEMEVEGMHHTKLSCTLYSGSSGQRFETLAPGADILQTSDIKTKHIDVLNNEAPYLLSKPNSQLSKCKEDLVSESVNSSSNMPSVSAYNAVKRTKEGDAQNHSESLRNEEPSSSNECSSNSDSITLDASSSKEKPFPCTGCPAQFTRKSNLNRHLLLHANERPFSCDRCSARFNQKSHLKEHLLIHTNEKAFTCDLCSAQFKQKSNLRGHMLVHTNEKAFFCDQCSARFNHKCNLQTHLLTHSNEKSFFCDQCSAEFKSNRVLKQHLSTHSNERAFTCDQCSAQFKRKSSLNKHLLIHSNKKACIHDTE